MPPIAKHYSTLPQSQTPQWIMFFLKVALRLMGGMMFMPILANAQSPETFTQFEVKGYQFEGNTVLSSEVLEEVTAPFRGEGKSFADIDLASEAIRNAYIKAGYPVVQVYAPQQTVKSGLIRMVMLEGKIKNILVFGNNFHDEENILRSVPELKIDKVPRVASTVSNLALANENPSKYVALNLKQGEQAGEVVAELNVNDDAFTRVNTGLDNGGGKGATYRSVLGYENANVFNLDHVLTMQFGTALDHPSRSRNYSVGYRIPIYPWGISVEGVAALSNSDSGETNTPNGPFEFTGKGTVLGLHISQPLPSQGAYRHRMIYGFDYKNFDNACSASGIEQDKRVCGTITAQPLSVGYYGQYAEPTWQINGNISFAKNVVGGPHGQQSDYSPSENPTGRNANWSALRAGVNLIVPLPLETQGWQITSALNGQWGKKPLISGEQFGVGGAQSVRGYTERALAGDSGYSGNVELQTPAFDKVLPFNGNLRFVAFHDFGSTSSHALPTTSAHRESIASLGVGFRLSVGKSFSARVDTASALKSLDTSTPGASRNKGQITTQFSLNYFF